MKIARCDRFGSRPYYYQENGAAHGPTIRGLLEAHREIPGDFSREGVVPYLRRSPDEHRTCFRHIRKIPGGWELHRRGDLLFTKPADSMQSPAGTLEEILTAAVARLAADSRPAALALSGGLDSAVVLALWRRVAPEPIPVYILESGLPGYCELSRALETARVLGCTDVTVVKATESDFVGALPDTVAGAEMPLYNLHPVSKLLLARAMKAGGYSRAITGDGADQAFAGAPWQNYIPLVGSLFRAAGVELQSPFLEEDVIARAARVGPDPRKSALREMARGLVPEGLIEASKVPGLAPPMDVSVHWRPALASRLSRELGIEVSTGTDPDRVLWTTLVLLAGSFPEEG